VKASSHAGRASRVALAICLLCAAVARADVFVSFDQDDYRSALVAAYSRQAGLNPIDPVDGDQVRVWYMGFPGTHPTVTGYVVTSTGVYRCRVKADLENDGVRVHRGQCSTKRRYPERLAAALARFGEGPGFDGKQLLCPVFDGWEADVEGLVGGKRFAFIAGNTNECAEKDGGDIAQVDSWLDAMSGAYYKDDDDEG
jgi:hypothetical protein